MVSDETGFAAVAETTSFLHYFSGLPDRRQAGNVDYPLPEVSHRDTKADGPIRVLEIIDYH